MTPEKSLKKTLVLLAIGLVVLGGLIAVAALFIVKPPPSQSQNAAGQTPATVPTTLAVTTSTLTSSDADAAAAAGSGAAPANLKTVTGGDSIALQWNVVDGAKSYNIFSNGKKVATTVPDVANYVNQFGNRYFDTAVSSGRKYCYRIQAVSASGKASSLTDPLCATQPYETTAVPTVITDSSQAPELDAWLQNSAKSTIQTWYPKVADVMVGTAYRVPSSMTVRIDKSYDGVAYTSGDVIVIADDWIRQHPEDLPMVVHESTHVLQNGLRNTPGLLVEGGASWASQHIYHDKEMIAPLPDNLYSDGYSSGAYFLNWMSTTYNLPNLVRDWTVASHSGEGGYAPLERLTGKPVQQSWFQMTGRKSSASLPVTTVGGLCLDVPSSNSTNGAQLQVWPCNGSSAEDIIVTSVSPNGAAALHVMGRCVDASGSAVRLWDCNNGVTQQWRSQANGTLINTQAQKCLDAAGRSPAQAGAILTLSACNSSLASQRWTVPTVVV